MKFAKTLSLFSGLALSAALIGCGGEDNAANDNMGTSTAPAVTPDTTVTPSPSTGSESITPAPAVGDTTTPAPGAGDATTPAPAAGDATTPPVSQPEVTPAPAPPSGGDTPNEGENKDETPKS